MENPAVSPFGKVGALVGLSAFEFRQQATKVIRLLPFHCSAMIARCATCELDEGQVCSHSLSTRVVQLSSTLETEGPVSAGTCSWVTRLER